MPFGTPGSRGSLQCWAPLPAVSKHRPRGTDGEDKGLGKVTLQPRRQDASGLLLTFRRARWAPKGHGGARGHSPAPVPGHGANGRPHHPAH